MPPAEIDMKCVFCEHGVYHENLFASLPYIGKYFEQFRVLYCSEAKSDTFPDGIVVNYPNRRPSWCPTRKGRS